MLRAGADVLGRNDLDAYGWASVIGITFQVVIHELGTLVVAWRYKLPLKFRFFGFGANATAILNPGRGMSGPMRSLAPRDRLRARRLRSF